MNKSKSQKTGGCKAAKFHTLKIRIPENTVRLLAACSAFTNETPETYATGSLLASLECDSNMIGNDFKGQL